MSNGWLESNDIPQSTYSVKEMAGDLCLDMMYEEIYPQKYLICRHLIFESVVAAIIFTGCDIYLSGSVDIRIATMENRIGCS